MSILGLAFLLYTVVLTSVCRKLLIFEQKKNGTMHYIRFGMRLLPVFITLRYVSLQWGKNVSRQSGHTDPLKNVKQQNPVSL